MKYLRIAAETIGWLVIVLALLGAVTIKTKQGSVRLLETSWRPHDH